MKRFLVLAALALTIGLAGCAGDVYIEAPAAAIQPPTEEQPPPIVAGTAYVSMVGGGNLSQVVPFWSTKVTLLTFIVAMDGKEDGILKMVLPEFYAYSYQELLPTGLLQNITLIAEDNTQVGIVATMLMQRPAAPENGWKDTTYTAIPSEAVITKGTMRTFRIVADTGWSWSYQLTTTLPNAGSGMFAGGIGDHIIIRGASSGELLEVRGEALGSPTFFYDPYLGGKG